MHDIVIRGGTIVDGTGKAGFTGDVAIDGDRIAAVGGKAGPGQREIDADGLLVTPGLGRRPHPLRRPGDLGPAAGALVLARRHHHPVRQLRRRLRAGRGREHRDALIDLMEGVEDIPGIALAEGLKWNWESFPEYLDALERAAARDRRRRADAAPPAARLCHGRARDPPRAGDRRRHRRDAPPDRGGAARRRLRLHHLAHRPHKTPSGDLVPGRYSEVDELLGIGAALGAVGYGAFGMNSDFEDEAAELDWMTKLGQETGRPVWFLLTDRPTDPERWKRLMEGVRAARAQGAPITAQVAGRPVGVILGLTTVAQPLLDPAELQGAAEACRSTERLARLRDPAVRRAILAEAPSRGAAVDRCRRSASTIATRWDRMYRAGRSAGLRAGRRSRSIAAIAAREGRDAGRGRLRLSRRRRRQRPVPVPGHQLRDRRPSSRCARC